MRFVPAPQRLRALAGEATKFGAVGVVNTVVDLAVFNLFLAVGPLKSKIVATVVATTVSYLLNRYWTYRDRPRSAMRREYTLFFVFNLAGLAITLAVLGAAKYGLGFTEDGDKMALNVANLVGIGLGTIFRFITYRTWVFKPEPAPAGMSEADFEVAAELVELDAELETRLAADGSALPVPAQPADHADSQLSRTTWPS